MSEIKSINKVNIRGTDILAGFNLTWPVGVTYPQYPGQKSPMELWGEFSTWEVVKYGGAFFRTEGGNAKEWLEPLPATTSDGLEFTVDLNLLPSEEERNKMKKTSNFNVGDVVAIGGEQRVVTAIADTAGHWYTSPYTAATWLSIVGFKVGSAFPAPYESITNAVVLQKQATARNGLNVENTDLSHNHNVVNPSKSDGWAYQLDEGGGFQFYPQFGPKTINIAGASTGAAIMSSGAASSMNHNHSLSGDVETRPLDATYRIWKRTA